MNHNVQPLFLNCLSVFVLIFLPVQGAAGRSDVAQAQLPSVQTTSNVVDLRIDEGPVMQGAWHLDPAVAPDVFEIGSALPYGSKKITFKTDVDEISFDVEAGNEYDFVFLLDCDTPCHTRIWARPDPAMWDPAVLVPVCVVFFALTGFLFARWKTLPHRLLLRCGVVAPVLFWLVTFVSAPIRGDYNHFENVISQLGEVGSPAEVFTSVALIVVGVLCVLFAIGFYKSSKELGVSTLPSILSLSMPVTLWWAAIFPLRNDLHGILGPLPLFVNVGALLAFVLWRRRTQLSSVRRWSLISFLVMMLLLLLFAGPLSQQYEGLVQRFWYFGWSLWFVSLSVGLSRLTLVSVPVETSRSLR